MIPMYEGYRCIDLSPQVEGTWGDYARTVIVQNGKAVRSYDTIMNAEWRRGVEMEKRLPTERHCLQATTFRPDKARS